jgi:hypothetical protein
MNNALCVHLSPHVCSKIENPPENTNMYLSSHTFIEQKVVKNGSLVLLASNLPCHIQASNSHKEEKTSPTRRVMPVLAEIDIVVEDEFVSCQRRR